MGKCGTGDRRLMTTFLTPTSIVIDINVSCGLGGGGFGLSMFVSPLACGLHCVNGGGISRAGFKLSGNGYSGGSFNTRIRPAVS